MDVFGKALLEHHRGPGGACLRSHSSLGDTEQVCPSYFFREKAEMPELERRALDLARGTVLDIGCGAGSHALILQDRGLECTALDASPGAIEVALSRGVRHAVCADINEFRVGDYTTLLLLMNGIGLAGTRDNLTPFLRHLKGLLQPGGQILLDSSDIIYMFGEEPEDGDRIQPESGYYGEVSYIWEFRGMRGQPFPWLFADYETLSRAAMQAGLQAEKIADGPHYDFLARLRHEPGTLK